MHSDTTVARRNGGCSSHRGLESLACLPLAIAMIPALFAGQPTPAEELPPIMTAWADCVLQCAEDYPDLGPRYDACVDECNEALRQVRGALVPALNDLSLDHSRDVPPKHLAAIRWARRIQNSRDTGTPVVQVVESLESFFANRWEDDFLRARFVDRYFVASVRDLALSGGRAPGAPQAVHDMIFRVARVEVLDRASYAGRACTLALALWVAQTSDERDVIIARSAHYELRREVEMLVRILEGYGAPGSGGKLP